jgi:DME family drug/metabolite transporter
MGVCLVGLSGVVLSTLGVGIRQIEAASGWQILFYRSLSFIVTLCLIIALRYRSNFFRAFSHIGSRGLLVGLFLACASSLYVFSMLNTTVANAVFMVSTTPFVAAALGWMLLKERVGPSTWIAMTVALAGIGLMLVDGFSGGGLIGVVLAAGVAVTTALMLVAVRGSQEIDMIPALVVAGAITAALSALMVTDFQVTDHDLLWIVVLGAGQYACGFALLTAGARYLPVAQVGLLCLMETVLAPVWAWWGAAEVPSMLTLIGGIVVLGAAGSRAWTALREQ